MKRNSKSSQTYEQQASSRDKYNLILCYAGLRALLKDLDATAEQITTAYTMGEYYKRKLERDTA